MNKVSDSQQSQHLYLASCITSDRHQGSILASEWIRGIFPWLLDSPRALPEHYLVTVRLVPTGI